MSDNKRAWWDNSNAERLGYQPQDESEDWADQILAAEINDTDDVAVEIYQGALSYRWKTVVEGSPI